MDGGVYVVVGTLGLFLLTFFFIVIMRFIGYRETLHLAEKGLVRPDRSANGGGKDFGNVFNPDAPNAVVTPVDHRHEPHGRHVRGSGR